MQEYFEGVERARTLLREDLARENHPREEVITEETTIAPPSKKYPRTWVSDAICEYATERNKKRKAARKRQKQGRRNSR